MPRSVEYYLSKGMDRQTAEYYAGGRRTIINASANEDFSLTLEFDNGETRILDARPFLKKGTVFETLMSIENFRRVYLDEEHCVSWDIDPAVDSKVVWNNKIDLCPDGCYLDSVPLEKE